MKKIVYATFAVVLFFAADVQAQNITGGIKAGLNLTDWRGDAKESFTDLLEQGNFAETQMKTGFHAGGYLVIPLGRKFVFEPALLYSQKGMKLTQTLSENTFLNVRAEITTQSHYLDLPLIAKYYVVEGFHVFAGPQLSYLIDNEMKAEAGIFGLSLEEKFDINRGFRKFDVGLTGGLGYQFENGVNLGVSYDHGLTSLDEGSGDLDIFNRAIKFSVGYTF